MLEKFKNDLTNEDDTTIYHKYLMGNDVWLFDIKMNKANGFYDELKRFIARSLKVNMNNLAVVGSSKLGFSLNPYKLFKMNDEKSDIDLIVVSPELFRKSWDAFFDYSKTNHIPSYQRVTSAVFQRFVSLKDTTPDNEFFIQWTVKMDGCKRDLQANFDIYREINYRIYESWDAVEAYHIAGIKKVRKLTEAKYE